MKWPWKAKAITKAGGKAEAPESVPADEAQDAPAPVDAAAVAAAAAAAAAAAERAAQERVAERWGRSAVGWQRWPARSPAGVDLLHWWFDEADLTALVGEDRYVERLAELLSKAAPRDVAAMGLGCNRRVDRACRFPEVCGLDPVVPPGGEIPSHRHGEVPGACSGFIDCWTRHEIEVDFTAGDRHRSVLLFRGGPDAALLWVDGVPVGEGEWLDKGGHWLEDSAACEADTPDREFPIGEPPAP